MNGLSGNPLIYVGAGVLVVAMACSTVLVALDKVDGTIYMAAVISPIVSGFIGAIAAIKGVQSGSQAATSPPAPDA